MTESIKQKLNEEIVKLPKENQEAINNSNWVKTTESIGKDFLLLDDEINKLQLETGIALIGLVDLNLFTLNIEYNVGVSKNESIKIVDELLEKVFTPIANMITSLTRDKYNPKNATWDKTINFILSGGDYSYFVKK